MIAPLAHALPAYRSPGVEAELLAFAGYQGSYFCLAAASARTSEVDFKLLRILRSTKPGAFWYSLMKIQ